jgi:hypothetical protein
MKYLSEQATKLSDWSLVYVEVFPGIWGESELWMWSWGGEDRARPPFWPRGGQKSPPSNSYRLSLQSSQVTACGLLMRDKSLREAGALTMESNEGTRHDVSTEGTGQLRLSAAAGPGPADPESLVSLSGASGVAS